MISMFMERRQLPLTLVVAIFALLLHDHASSFSPSSGFSAVKRHRNAVPSSNEPNFRLLSIARRKSLTVHNSQVSSSSSSSAKTRVIFQKVVKSPSNAGDPMFLGHLVEYLQDHFELPDDLPMIYKAMDVDNENNSEKAIQRWDSPLSQSPEATRLDLEVVAIYTDDKKKNTKDDTPGAGAANNSLNTVPTMAMVVVRKAVQAASSKPTSLMAQNLFEDSERRILDALDRGLDKFAAGKIQLEGTKTLDGAQRQTMEAAQAAMIEEMLDDAAETHPAVASSEENQKSETTSLSSSINTKEEPEILDAEYTRVDLSPKPDMNGQKKTTTKTKMVEKDPGQDFAVQAAKLAASRKQSKKAADTPDFAVEAAKKAAKSRRSSNSSESTPKSISIDKIPVSSNGSAPRQSPSTKKQKPPSINIEGNAQQGFRAVISTPEKFKARKKAMASAQPQIKDLNGKESPEQKKPAGSDATGKGAPASKLNGVVNKEAPLPTVDATKEQTSKPETKEATTAKMNTETFASVDRKKQAASQNKPSSETASSKDDGPTDEEIMQTASDIMEEIANQGTDMSPEELLQDVLKFGESKDQENQVGSGFVTGAFEKAKELLREQKRVREERIKAESVSSKEESPKNSNREVKTRVVSTEEEELRRIFEAGERLADSRISLSNGEQEATTTMMSKEDKQEIDDLISSDKSVSGHARILDDELAELEARINQSPGEELDGKSGANPIFDIFSGPEVYNPNVDPTTAVNWPGALPGTKPDESNKLPKELNEAVKQANFAADVLQKLEERDIPGSDNKAFFVGERQLSEQQVENLQAVANEAIELGIIRNPLVLMEERARLQMVLDELWNQPEERTREVVSNYKDLLLSDNFVTLITERLQAMVQRDLASRRQTIDDDENDTELEKNHARERELLGQLVVNAQLLLKETRALGAELEAQQIEVIRSICKVAMDPSHVTEEEAAIALTDAVRDMRPLFDDMFLSYLKYAIAEEEGRLARAGVLDDPEHNQWLFVLRIVQQGVHTEIAKGINRYIEHIWYVLRMETPIERKMLLSKLIDDMPTLDVRPFVRVVGNIVGALGESARGDFDGAYELGSMTDKLLQLHRDMKELLPPERVDEMARDADEWAAKRKEKMMEARKLTKQRLKAARDTEGYDEEIESLGRRGEMERFE